MEWTVGIDDAITIEFALNFLECYRSDGHVDDEGVARWSDGHVLNDWQVRILDGCGIRVDARACDYARKDELGAAYAAYHRC